MLLFEDGTVAGAGVNGKGQLGNGTTTTATQFTEMYDGYNMIQISAGSESVSLLRGDTSVWTIGLNTSGQLGINNTTNSSYLRQVINSTKDGALRNITQIASGGWHTVVLNKNQQVYAWGLNTSGQLGQDTVANSSFPVAVLDETDGTNGVGNIRRIGASERVTFVMTENNELFATGENTANQLSQGHTTDVLRIARVLDTSGEKYMEDVINVSNSSANTNNTALIKSDGSVWAVGTGTNGQIGQGKYENVTLYTRVGSPTIATSKNTYTLSVGGTESLNPGVHNGFNVYEDELDTLGNVKYTSYNPSIATVNADGLITGVKQGQTRIMIEDLTNYWKKVVTVYVTRDGQDVINAKVETGSCSVVLKTDGTVWSFGDNSYGQRGVGTIDTYKYETQVLAPDGINKLENIIDVSAGSQFILALTQDGNVLAWGRGDYGQIGDNKKINQYLPCYVVDENGERLSNITKVIAGGSAALALKDDGTVWAWGYNGHAQLGNNSTTNSGYAVQVFDATGKGFLTGIMDISSTSSTSYALTEAGEVYAWGRNAHGTLGNGSVTRRKNSSGNYVDPQSYYVALPKKASITDVVKIVGGGQHAVALKSDGTVWCWGLNTNGQCGYGSRNNSDWDNGNYRRPSPTQSRIDANTVLTDIVDIGASSATSYAMASDGTLYAWGYGGTGGVGNGGTSVYTYAQVMKGRYGEALDGDIIYLSRNTSQHTSIFIRDDGTLMGVGQSNFMYKLLTERTANILYMQELKSDTALKQTGAILKLQEISCKIFTTGKAIL